MSTFEDQLESLDTQLFEYIESQTTSEDQRSLLALQVACRRKHENFTWLEIGSYLGGSLQPLVRDPRCARIDSIDVRPSQSPDERMMSSSYPDNSTEHMLNLLRAVPGANTDIVRTFGASTEALDPEAFDPPQVCFVDGEHTNKACERDAEFSRRVLRDRGVIAFHDVFIVYEAIAAFIDRLKAEGVQYRTAYLPIHIFAVELGDSNLLDDPAVIGRRHAVGEGLIFLLQQSSRYRALLNGRRARVLRRLRVLPPTHWQ